MSRMQFDSHMGAIKKTAITSCFSNGATRGNRTLISGTTNHRVNRYTIVAMIVEVVPRLGIEPRSKA